MLYLIYLAALPAGNGNHEHEDLVRRAQRDDTKAFEQLTAIIAPKIKAFLIYEVPPNIEVEEVVVIAMTRLYFCIKSFRFESSITTFAFKIARHVKNDMIRREPCIKGVSTISELTVDEDDDVEERVFYSIQSDDENDILIDDSLKQVIDMTLAELSDDHREIIILSLIEKFNNQQISKILKISEGTIKSRLSRAKKSFIEKFEKNLKNYQNKGTV